MWTQGSSAYNFNNDTIFWCAFFRQLQLSNKSDAMYFSCYQKENLNDMWSRFNNVNNVHGFIKDILK